MSTPASGHAHGRLHKRGSSLSSTTTSPTLQDVASLSYRPSFDNRRVLYEEPLEDFARAGSPGTGIKIKPYLRKLSLKEENARVDLSKSVAENEALAGLGIQDFNSVASRSASDVRFEPVNSSRSRHQRATSNGSQFSTNSASQRPSAPYMHPMRHTPRPYTPPIAKSYTTSVLGSEDSDEREAVDVVVPAADDDLRYRASQRGLYDPPFPNPSASFTTRTDSISPTTPLPVAPAPLHVHTSGSFTRLALQNPSQSSLTGSSMPTSRSRGGTLASFVSVDTASPSSRTSMDKAIGMFRGRSAAGDEPDAAARAASIRAARIAYNEREEAKAAKAEKEEMRRLGKEQRRQERRARGKSDPERKNSSSNEKVDVFAAKGYEANKPAHTNSLPSQVSKPPSRGASQSARARREREQKRRGAKSTWLSFMAWFRKRLLKLGRVMHISS